MFLLPLVFAFALQDLFIHTNNVRMFLHLIFSFYMIFADTICDNKTVVIETISGKTLMITIFKREEKGKGAYVFWVNSVCITYALHSL